MLVDVVAYLSFVALSYLKLKKKVDFFYSEFHSLIINLDDKLTLFSS